MMLLTIHCCSGLAPQGVKSPKNRLVNLDQASVLINHMEPVLAHNLVVSRTGPPDRIISLVQSSEAEARRALVSVPFVVLDN